MLGIEIRAWDKENEEMWYDVLTDMGENDMYDDELSMWSVAQMMKKGDSYEKETGDKQRFDFMLLTRLKDNKGKDIYVKDIVSTSKGNSVICYDEHQGKYKVVPIKLYLQNAGNGGWTGFDFSIVKEVIGDVYNNKELLVV